MKRTETNVGSFLLRPEADRTLCVDVNTVPRPAERVNNFETLYFLI